MSAILLTVFSTALSAIAVLALRAVDEKRRRTLRLESSPIPESVRAALWVSVFGPGILLLAAGANSAFVCWLGVLTIGGWLLAAARPKSTGSAAAAPPGGERN